MIDVFLALALVVGVAGDPVGAVHADRGPSPVDHAAEREGLRDLTVTTRGGPIATASLVLRRVEPPSVGATAEYMSLGPWGAALPDTDLESGRLSIGPWYRRLRVTLNRCETSVWLSIDDMKIGRADTRVVSAQYLLYPLAFRELWAALPRAPWIVGSEPAEGPIRWISPTSFAWITRSDTLFVEQKADSLFQVSLHARVR